MNLLKAPWIPVRADGGAGAFCLLTYQQLLCEPGNWQVSLPRDDLELACVQLLVCMTQVMFMPEGDPSSDPNGNKALRARITKPLSSDEFDKGIAPCNRKGEEWFDLDHPTQPFMQSRKVTGKLTSVQKLLPGLPEKTSTAPGAHCFFNEVTEARHISGAVAAIARGARLAEDRGDCAVQPSNQLPKFRWRLQRQLTWRRTDYHVGIWQRLT